MPRCLLVAAFLFALLPAPARAVLTTTREVAGLTRPVYVTAPAGDAQRLFLVEQAGLIKILKNGVVLATPFLDITGIVDDTGNEQGLLGLAFDPDFDTNGHFYVYFTFDPAGANPDQSRIQRYTVSAGNPDIADAGSAVEIFRWNQDFSNHNGGQIEFGPDGYLYIGLGDGGSGGDPNNNAQNGMQLLGKMLRIDPNGADAYPADPDNNYAIPALNPFVGNASFRDEIWAYGLRNPYRWSFDRATGDMYIADVGQNAWEEIDFQHATSGGGQNYGWRCWEGTHSYNQNPACLGPIVFPIREYSHGQDGFSCSVTGGYVYRGSEVSGLQGTYFYADYCSNQIYTFRYDGATLTELTNRTAELIPDVGAIQSIVAFGEDGMGELYIVDQAGEVFRVKGSIDPPSDAPAVERPGHGLLLDAAPNPFVAGTRLALRLDGTEQVKVSVYDAAGRLVRHLLEGTYSGGDVPVLWDGRDDASRPVPGGVYFVHASTGSGNATKRVTRIR